MPIEVLMPALSPTMKDGNIANWLKKEGDSIKSGDMIAEIETDKAIMEVESTENGTIGKILVPRGTSNVKVNTVIALILEKGEDKAILENYKPKLGFLHGDEGKTELVQEKTKQAPAVQTKNESIIENKGRTFASPLAKRIAEEKAIDISKITGSGPHGRVIKSDVELFNNSSCSSGKCNTSYMQNETRVEKVSNMRRIIAERLQESKQTVPHFYLNVDCVADELLKTRELINNSAPKDKDGKSAYKISVNDLIVKYVAVAMKNKPMVNCSWNEDSIIYYGNIDISVAVSIPGGLITPIVKNADQKGVIAISGEIKELAKKARANELKPEEFQGGSITISNLGMYGIDGFSAIVNPPQACIISVGGIIEKAISKSGQIVSANVMSIGLSVDHRALDGSVAAEFLMELKKIIENPALAVC